MIEAENHSPSSVGETLRSARTSKKKTIQYYADKLRIRAFYLEQLEAGHYHELPALVYSIGFVRLYANELGLDSMMLVEKFKSEFHPVLAPFERDSQDYSPTQRKIPLKQMVACLAVLVLLGGAWVVKGYLTSSPPLEVASFQPAPEQDSSLVASAPEVGEAASQTAGLSTEAPSVALDAPIDDNASEESLRTAQVVAPIAAVAEVPSNEVTLKEESVSLSKPVELTQRQKNNLILTASTDSWIEVRNRDKEVILSRVVQAGKTCALPCQEGYTFATGNAKGVSLELNGKKLKKFSGDEKVIRDVSLDPSSLRARLSSENH